MTNLDRDILREDERFYEDPIRGDAPDGSPEESQKPKRRKNSGRDEREERLEQRVMALQIECQRTEAERRSSEKRKKAIHASYCLILAVVFLAALIILPKLQRKSYLKGYDEGIRQSAKTDESQAQRSDRTPHTESAENPIAQPESADETEPISSGFIGNKKSKKFHLPSCTGLPKESNQVFFDSREEAIEEGYIPCSICNP